MIVNEPLGLAELSRYNAGHFGCPYHGVVAGGRIFLPNVITLEYPQPPLPSSTLPLVNSGVGCQTFIFRPPWAKGATPLPDEARAGWTWPNHAVLAGKDFQVHGAKLSSSGGFGFLWAIGNTEKGEVWRVTLNPQYVHETRYVGYRIYLMSYAYLSSCDIYLTFDRFGVLGHKPPPPQSPPPNYPYQDYPPKLVHISHNPPPDAGSRTLPEFIIWDIWEDGSKIIYGFIVRTDGIYGIKAHRPTMMWATDLKTSQTRLMYTDIGNETADRAGSTIGNVRYTGAPIGAAFDKNGNAQIVYELHETTTIKAEKTQIQLTQNSDWQTNYNYEYKFRVIIATTESWPPQFPIADYENVIVSTPYLFAYTSEERQQWEYETNNDYLKREAYIYDYSGFVVNDDVYRTDSAVNYAYFKAAKHVDAYYDFEANMQVLNGNLPPFKSAMAAFCFPGGRVGFCVYHKPDLANLANAASRTEPTIIATELIRYTDLSTVRNGPTGLSHENLCRWVTEPRGANSSVAVTPVVELFFSATGTDAVVMDQPVVIV